MVINQTCLELSSGILPGNRNMVDTGRFSGQEEGQNRDWLVTIPDIVFRDVDYQVGEFGRKTP